MLIDTIQCTKTDDLEITPDDRQTLVQTVTNTGAASVTVEDYGVVDNGEIISFSSVLSANDYATIRNIWKTRQRVTVTLDDGTVINNARIVIKRIQYANNLLNRYKEVQIEVWRI